MSAILMEKQLNKNNNNKGKYFQLFKHVAQSHGILLCILQYVPHFQSCVVELFEQNKPGA